MDTDRWITELIEHDAAYPNHAANCPCMNTYITEFMRAITVPDYGGLTPHQTTRAQRRVDRIIRIVAHLRQPNEEEQ